MQNNSLQSYAKTYPQHGGYAVTVNPHQGVIDYGDKIRADSATTQNFNQAENWVVLECVDRLLTQGYLPEHIVLEKTWPAGHGTSGRLDICVERPDGRDYLLIECKTAGAEYKKAVDRMLKDGGQLFTYFKFSNQADVIMLYASEWVGGSILYHNTIVKIEDVHRSGGAQDFYLAWNKLPKDNGVFEAGIKPYGFQSRALKLADLQPISESDSHKIFNQFLEILRHNVVSDKPNAFNKIFTLFLCKVFDEKDTKGEGADLRFQWLEGIDDDVSFQLRLTELYRLGMKDFLDKEVTDFSESDFRNTLEGLSEASRNDVLHKIRRLRLEKNNEFAIKEVFDQTSFEDNAKVVKEVVQLLQGFRIRYNKRHQYLSDFFELLLTTGLKQEVGQFFTPVPIAQFIIKSLPLAQMVQRKLEAGRANELLPYVIDYAAGSGHFLTETMHEMQGMIDRVGGAFSADTKRRLTSWQGDHFAWAEQYIYGVEKDYRLVKVGKVGCYLHGDGLANIMLSDGLGSFSKNKEYKDKLTVAQAANPQHNAQFDVVVSNPPYSVSAFKPNSRRYYGAEDFLLYDHISDDGSEIEALFIERTLQLLKEGGVAGVVLPRSFLSNGGVYERARSMLLEGTELIALAEFGSNTFMATGTNTVVVFLRRTNDLLAQQINRAIDRFFDSGVELVINGIATPISDYLAHVWGSLPLADYTSLLRGKPSDTAVAHELYQRYVSELTKKGGKQKKDVFVSIRALEKQKLLHFILACNKQVVIIKSGADKEQEQAFLGYKFSNRRGNEGIHPVRGKRIDDCTMMFDPERFDNPKVASTYVLQAFAGKPLEPVDPQLTEHIHRMALVDMLTFDNASFDKSLGTFAKKKANAVASKWPLVRIKEVSTLITKGTTPTSLGHEFVDAGVNFVKIECVSDDGNLTQNKFAHITEECHRALGRSQLAESDILISIAGSFGRVAIVPKHILPANTNQALAIVRLAKAKILAKYLYLNLKSDRIKEQTNEWAKGVAQYNLSLEQVGSFQIPLPPLDIQRVIIAEFEVIEQKEFAAQAQAAALERQMQTVLERHLEKGWPQVRLGDVCSFEYGKPLPESARENGSFPVIGSNGRVGFHSDYLVKGPAIVIGRKGSAGKVVWEQENCFPIDTAFYVVVHQAVTLPFLYLILKTLNLVKIQSGIGVPGLNRNTAYQLQFPLPPVDEQEAIVRELKTLEVKRDKALQEVERLKAEKANVLQQHL